MDITATDIPPQSHIYQRLPGADFYDCYQRNITQRDASALELYLKTVSITPRWIDTAMVLRNRIVRLFGLKDLGRLSAIDTSRPAADYRVGDRIGIFSIVYLSENEVILGDADKHLNVEVSVCKLDGAIAVSTVVHIRRTLGRLYMLFVGPAHRRIVPAMLRKASFL